MKARKDASGGRYAANRRALHDYAVLAKVEAGIQLLGTEVKSVKASTASLAGAYARIEAGQVWVLNLSIPPYEQGNRFNHEPARPRRLLLHRNEIERLRKETDEKGHTLIPLALYAKQGLIKVELAVCQGKQQHDKRDDLKRREADRAAQRAVRRSG